MNQETHSHDYAGSDPDLHAASAAHAKGKPRGKPFPLGNRVGKGRPLGSRNKKTMLLQETLDDYGQPVIRKALKMAMDGDRTALKLVFERVLPLSHQNRITLDLPEIETLADLPKMSAALLGAVLQGEITIDRGCALTEMLRYHGRLLETETLERRIAVLEQRGSASDCAPKLETIDESLGVTDGESTDAATAKEQSHAR